MAYDAASGMWTPDPNSSTADKVNGMLTAGNPFVEQAKSAGMDVANSRGLMNSSIAAGASQKAAYDAVTPIATADASIAAQKDLSAQNYHQTDAITGKQITSTEKIASEGNANSLTLADKNNANSLAVTGLNNTNSLALADKNNASQQTISGNSNAKDLQIADANVKSNQQDKASTAAQNYANIYATTLNNINSNKDIPAASRAQYLADAKTQYDNNMALVQQVYGVSLNWGQPQAPAAPGAPSAYAPGGSAPTGGGYDPGQGGPYVGNAANNGGVAYTDNGGNQYDSSGRYLGTV